jgi:predicted HNH restriction endonuclease
VWRKAVFKRDNYMCKKCGKIGFINAHHIKEWASNPDKRFDVNNGLTLCIECHGRIHKRDFTKRMTRKVKV